MIKDEITFRSIWEPRKFVVTQIRFHDQFHQFVSGGKLRFGWDGTGTTRMPYSKKDKEKKVRCSRWWVRIAVCQLPCREYEVHTRIHDWTSRQASTYTQPYWPWKNQCKGWSFFSRHWNHLVDWSNLCYLPALHRIQDVTHNTHNEHATKLKVEVQGVIPILGHDTVFGCVIQLIREERRYIRSVAVKVWQGLVKMR